MFKNKYLVVFVLICFIFTSLFFTYTRSSAISAEASLFLVGTAISGSTLLLVTGIGLGLVALGLIFHYKDDLLRAVENFYNSLAPEMKVEVMSGINEEAGTFEVSDNVYEAMKTHVITDYSADTAPIFSGTKYNHYNNGHVEFYYNAGPVEKYIRYHSLTFNGYVVSFGKVIINETESKYSILVNGEPYNSTHAAIIGAISYDEYYNEDMILYSPSNWNFWVSNDIIPSFYWQIDGRYLRLYFDYGPLGWGRVQTICKVWGPMAVQDVIINYGVDIPVFGDETFDWKDTGTGKRIVSLPQTLDDVIGLTSEDVQNDIFGEDNPTHPETGFWSDIWSWLQSFWQKLADLFNSLGIRDGLIAIQEWLAGIASNISSITAEMTASNDNWSEFNLPDIFILILDVLLAGIRLILRFIVWLVTFPSISADSSLLNTNMVKGLDFVKKQTLPIFGMSIYDLFSAVVAFVFSIIIVQKVRRISHV